MTYLPAPREAALDHMRGMQTRLAAMQSNLSVLNERSQGLAAALAELRGRRRSATASLPRLPEAPALTPREVQILRLIAEGRDNDTIAAELHFSLGTIKLHVREILETLGCTTRAAAAARAVRLRLI